MTLRHIRIFLAVCDNGYNVTQAAKTLYMAQPAVSAAIRELEEEYGIRLFDRISRRFYITDAGKRFYQYARKMDVLYRDMERDMRNWNECGILRIGCSITVGSRLMPEYVKQFSFLHPKIQVQVVVQQSELLEKRLLQNELDFAILEGVVHEPGLVNEAYLEDHLVPVTAANGDFTPWQTLSVEEFRNQPFLLREKGSGTREIFDKETEAAGFSVQPVWESASNTALIQAAAAGLGITVLSQRLTEEMVSTGILCPLLVSDISFHRQFRIVYHQDKYLSAAATDFILLCKKTADNAIPKITTE